MSRRGRLIVTVMAAAVAAGAGWTVDAGRLAAQARPAVPDGVAYFVRDLTNPRDRAEAHAELLDAPVLPGSVMKAVALVAALESGVIDADTGRMCRRVATVDGHRYVCSHPDLKRPLTPAEALAHSCNDFFVSLAPRLPRSMLNRVRTSAGLAPVPASTPLSAAIVGLDGPRVSPRALIDVMARLVGVGPDPAVPMKPETRAVLIEGLKGAASFGTASALGSAGISALAKTGTITSRAGTPLGLVVALTPADKPTRAVLVVAPGGAGVDAAAIAATLLKDQPVTKSAPLAPLAPVAPSSIRLGRTLPNGKTRVETILLDDYIAQVLAGEGQPRAGDAAQQALAITARTFALANRNRHRSEGFDLCDTTHCQVVRPSTPTTRRAAEATSGHVLLNNGQAAFVFYSAWCGGRTELASQVWPGAIDYSYEPSLHDDACENEPGWTSEVKAGDLERALRAAGLRGSRLRELRILARDASQRVARVRVGGFTPSEMSGHEFRMAVGRIAGWQALKSTAFNVERTSAGYRFRGKGNGHGVGLCVVGAGNRAARGATADDILKFYFPGLTIGWPGPVVTTTARGGAASAPPAPSAPVVSGIALALPSAEESERAVVLSLLQRARDSVVKATGVAPRPVKVTVHPTVESFGRATGQPWWVSGATAGTEIDVLPVATLRQQGQLERTLAHEMTHALLDAALADRPMWVREGAAAYYANPQAAAASAAAQRSRVACPADAELTRPISAGAQRDAYARAEACFAKAIADGKRWAQVK